jgi:hypothetical protein
MNRIYLKLTLAAAFLTSSIAAHASTLTFTFTGNANGLVSNSGGTVLYGFTSFTLSIPENDPTIETDSGYYRIYDTSGLFTDAYGNQQTLTDLDLVVNSNAGVANVGFYNPAGSDGLALDNNALAGYTLSSSIGPLTGTLSPAFGGGDFTTASGDTVEFTTDGSLSFSAAQTPEPSSLTLLASGISALGMFVRRRRIRR